MDVKSDKCSGRLGYSTASGIAFDAFNTSGFDTTLQRGPDGLIIDHNTVTAPTWDPAHVHGTWMMWLRGSITGLSITNNVYDPNGAVMGTNTSAGLSLAASTTGMSSLAYTGIPLNNSTSAYYQITAVGSAGESLSSPDFDS